MDPITDPLAPDRPQDLFQGLRDVAAATVRRVSRDRLSGLAAEVSFYFLLAVPPMLVAVASLAGVIADLFGTDVSTAMGKWVVRVMGGFLSPDTARDVVTPFIAGVFEQAGSVFSISLVVAIWSSSRMVNVLVQAMNIAYDVPARRKGWMQRLVAIGLTLSMIVLFVVYLLFLIVGPNFGRTIDGWIGVGVAATTIWTVLYWPAAIVAGIALLTSLYHAAPNWQTAWRRCIPGAVTTGAVWFAAAVGLRLYVRFSFADAAAGPLAAPLVALIWLYVSAFAVLLGAEVNAAVEQTWPTAESHPKDEAA